MSGILTTSKWLKFFRDAGLPPNVATNYAVLFTDNRITTDMLLDLTKEYLYDMGIKVMGDVISILRYARTAYTQDAQEKIFKDLPSQTQKSTPVTRILNHYSKQFPEKRRGVPVTPVKRTAEFEVPVAKKFSRVSSENTGSLQPRIQCDSSEKEKSAAQLQLQGKRSVFHRLGENSVSSSTDFTKAKMQAQNVNVFRRLGANSGGAGLTASQSASSTVIDQEEGTVSLKRVVKTGAPLQYRGVLKYSSPPKKPITFLTSTPIQAPKGAITEWIKPSLLQRKVNVSQPTRIRPKITTRVNITSDPTLLFRRSVQEAEAQRRPVGNFNNVKTRLGVQEKTLTVKIPKAFQMRKQLQAATSFSSMMSDNNSEVQRKNRITLAKAASNNRVIHFNKSQGAGDNVFSRLENRSQTSNVFSRLGS